MDKCLSSAEVEVCSNLFTVLSDKDTIKITSGLLNENKTYAQLLSETQIAHEKLTEKLMNLIELNILRYKDKEEMFTIGDAYVLNLMRQAVGKTQSEIFNAVEM